MMEEKEEGRKENSHVLVIVRLYIIIFLRGRGTFTHKKILELAMG
jgi:hypothetical protein